MIGLKIVLMPKREEQFSQRINAKQPEAFRELFSEFYNSLVLFAMGFVEQQDVAEDIVQEVFVSFWMNKKRTVFSGSVRSYLFGAVAKAASKFATRRGRVMFDDVEKYVDQFLEELGEYDEDEFACLRDKVYARVEALPERTKEIFKAVVLNNLTYQQVGERFGITVNTVKTLYYRALKQLKEELGGIALVLFFIILR